MAVRWSRWSDHLPLWVSLGIALSAGIYEPGELLLMGLPLAIAAVVEAFRWDLGRHQRWLEILALLIFLVDLSRGQGVFTVAIHTLYVLGGVRLMLPRELAHRRQLLLMSFLLFLTAAVGTADILFLVWTLAWACAATQALLQQSWEPSAALRRGASPSPPLAHVPLWVGAALLLGAGFFVILPRLNLGLRPGLLAGASRAFGQAGLGERLDLAGGGPIEPNPDVAVRIEPPAGVDPVAQPEWTRGLDLLRGITLEAVQGFRWEPHDLTPPVSLRANAGSEARRAEFLFSPSPHGILTLPAGVSQLDPPELLLPAGPGGSIRWRYARLRTVPVTVVWNPALPGQREPRLSPHRQELLTHLDPTHEAARRASFRYAPGILTTPQLARTLEAALQRFAYTLDNPSGRAANPIEDFLERTQAGHCEYFASALALMLRARGIPARVVNGYRLGPWIPEGGYFRVSQNEAHSWVEYWHEGRWWTADPTPRGAAGLGAGPKELGALSRWLDAARYRWERYVVRFSDQDQQNGLAWMQGQLQGWLQGWEWRWRAPSPTQVWALGLAAAAWILWRSRGLWRRPPPGPGRIRALRPLLARTRAYATPEPGATARTWLLALGALRPERRADLLRLADAVDAEAYGAGSPSAAALARAEAEAWRNWKAPTSARSSRKPS
ncbi:MAG TPA: transglutaminaseTgpA domain-containing protein [Geothrix sp.]|nr:transglutaminaseTgpA domain-containing protein [Geothrix sp.]